MSIRPHVTWKPVWMQIRPARFRGEAGWLLCGLDRLGRKVRIFDQDKGVLMTCRWIYRNEHITPEECIRRVDLTLSRKPFSLIA